MPRTKSKRSNTRGPRNRIRYWRICVTLAYVIAWCNCTLDYLPRIFQQLRKEPPKKACVREQNYQEMICAAETEAKINISTQVIVNPMIKTDFKRSTFVNRKN